MNDGARVEAVLWPENGLDLGAVALVDRALDDEMKMRGAAVALDDDVAGREVADVERVLELVELVMRKTVEGRVVAVEIVRHAPSRSNEVPAGCKRHPAD